MGGWNAGSVAASVALFVLAGVFEVGGGWLVWKACREVRIIRRGTARARPPPRHPRRCSSRKARNPHLPRRPTPPLSPSPDAG